MMMFNEVEMAIWSLQVVSKLWWLIVDYLVNLKVVFSWSWIGYLKFLDGKPTRGVQIMMVNSGFNGGFNGGFS